MALFSSARAGSCARAGRTPPDGADARRLLRLGPPPSVSVAAGDGEQMEELERLSRELSRDLGRCVMDFSMLQAGDRVMVCLSGGKDSYTLLHLLERLRTRAPIRFSLLAVHLDQGQPGYDGGPLERYLAEHGFDHRIVREDTFSVVKENVAEGSTYCSLCSRLRRGVLYNVAQELGCTKIALGHHRDDAIETLLLNLMYTGALASMPPKLHSRDGRNTVIRPLLYAHEPVIARYAELMGFPILPCRSEERRVGKGCR